MATDDGVQHGIDDNPHDDPKKGAALGGLGGAAVGAAAGSLIGPVGTIVGAIVGGLSGAVGSGAAVAVVDRMDNDDTVSGVGTGATQDANDAASGLTTKMATGAAPATGASGVTNKGWDDVSPHYRQGWEQHYQQSGEKWEENEAAHRYAWETRNKPEYRGRAWSEVETDLQRDWETRHPGKSWASASSSVREGWETTGEVLRLHEEQLTAHKQPVQAGEVALRKEVITENKTIEVPVTREEVVVERRPVTGGPVSTSVIGEGEEIRVPVMEEQVTVDKTAVVKEEVSIGKRQVQETQQVTDTVRHEEARVEQEGNVRKVQE
ncbi:MAG TPA: YsnF/AvaK domain-containing protein [Abditibacteriaceae bacterium]|nr:YsnF/AvaK domain-containing protein [Abditibacteriaceae bacterium]